ncbi:GntR family transcriptional regulator [Rhizobium sp. DBTS2]|uniref:GntR family transcriptional regulator n=1 Tax=Mycoplana rhizolycopersici TaxID=2746702 RepID=A0ABX2QGG0_9HYPH|nr:GntR family transcriptional regulator [Rhizobium rhizolycopersici]
MATIAGRAVSRHAPGFPAAGSTVQRVHDDLRKRIITIQLPPDTTLSRTELTATYEVNQAPIREAMQLLKQEGPLSRTIAKVEELRSDFPHCFA